MRDGQYISLPLKAATQLHSVTRYAAARIHPVNRIIAVIAETFILNRIPWHSIWKYIILSLDHECARRR